MTRINPITRDQADEKTGPLLDAVNKQMGRVPNLLATLGQSPAALEGFLGFSKALGGSSLNGKIREQIALAVAGANNCGYCAAAHTAVGSSLGIDPSELTRSLEGDSIDAKTGTVLAFARAIVAKRGFVGDDDLDIVRAAGLSDREIIEVVAAVALNLFTNYINHVAETEVDFPTVALPEAAVV